METIAAISTPPGSGGIGVVRVSGPDAVAIAQRLFLRPSGLPLSCPESHRVYYGHIIDVRGERVDEVLLCLMRQPHSYTREDVVEISCHGGMINTQCVLDAVLAQGARAAEPGEFTRRAFMNGRLDLAQAEAVIDLINARTLASHRAALHQLGGALSRYLRDMREDLLQVSVYLEAGIDFPEEDIELVAAGGLVSRLEVVEAQCRRLLGTFARGRMMREGLATAIIGRPNVGKSSLLNALLGRDRAIVSPQPGTTRDTIEAELDLDGLLLRIIDTAGIRATADAVEQEGVRRAQDVIGRAELLIVVLDGSAALTSDDHGLLQETVGKSRILVQNKVDLPMLWDPQDLAAGADEPLVALSARHGKGLADLERTIVRLAVGQEALHQDEAILMQARHRQCLDTALRNVCAAAEGLRQGIPLEFVAFEVTEAIRQVSEVLGENGTGDILDRIFSRFCIGK